MAEPGDDKNAFCRYCKSKMRAHHGETFFTFYNAIQKLLGLDLGLSSMTIECVCVY